jgi:hypothetical protein
MQLDVLLEEAVLMHTGLAVDQGSFSADCQPSLVKFLYLWQEHGSLPNSFRLPRSSVTELLNRAIGKEKEIDDPISSKQTNAVYSELLLSGTSNYLADVPLRRKSQIPLTVSPTLSGTNPA